MSMYELFTRLNSQGITLELDNDHLEVNAPRSKLTPGILSELRENKEEIIAFLRDHVQKQEAPTPIKNAPEKEFYVLSSAQKRLYILHQMMEGNTGYNIPTAMQLTGSLDLAKLEDAFRRLIQRHESLRTSFHTVEDQPVQEIHNTAEFNIEYFDLNAEEYQGETQNSKFKIINSFIRPFDLSQAPLLRVGLIRENNQSHILLVDTHHIISDGTSLGILAKDFMSVYRGEDLPPLKLQYKDYSEWQMSDKYAGTVKEQEEYWLRLFEGEIPVLELPCDFPRPPIQGFEGNSITFEISKEDTGAMSALAIETGGTLYMVLLAIYNIWLSKISRQKDIVIGTPVAGREHPGLGQIIGVFINTLALRNYPSGDKTFMEFLHEVKDNTLQAFENQEYPYDRLVECLEIERDISRNPLFDVMLTFQNTEAVKIDIPGLNLSPYNFENKTSKFDLSLYASQGNENLHLTIVYDTNLFREETIIRFTGYFKRIISQVIQAPGIQISGIEIMPDEEKGRILNEFNDTEADYPKGKTIHRIFRETAERNPGKTALVHQNLSLTYRELNEKSNQLARRLREMGLGTGAVAAVMTHPSFHMIIGIMAILKTGGCYLPIDPGFPQQRIEYMLRDTQCRTILCRNDFTDTLAGLGELINIEDDALYHGDSRDLKQTGEPGDPLYAIYTSGTSGKPKGVLLRHENLVNYVSWFQAKAGVTGKDKAVLISSFAFDLGYTAIYPPILSGGELHLVQETVYHSPDELLNYLGDNGITYIKLTPSLFSVIVRSRNFSKETLESLRLVVLGGEAIVTGDVERAHTTCAHLQIMNHYGPTETTIGSIARFIDFTRFEDYCQTPTIGNPIANTQVFILDGNSTPVPVGIAAELCIGGDGVSSGYLNQPELTAQKFTPHPTRNRGKIYRTGDLARWLPDGNIEFLGRLDHQVKIRGYRVELGEIENRLTTHENINESVVVLKKDTNGEHSLCAYIVANEELSVSRLREFLAEELADYMIPSYFVNLDKIPVNANGKVDRKALPEPEGISLTDDVEYIPPKTVTEKKLAETWEKVLNREKIGINENFFSIGGDSIKSIQIISRLNSEQLKLEMRDLFQYPSIALLAPHVKKVDRIPVQSAVTGEIPLTPIQQRFFADLLTDPHHYNHAVMLHSNEGFEEEAIAAVFKKLQEHHDVLRMTYKTEDGKILQINRGTDYPLSLQTHDLRKKKEGVEILEEKANEIQAGIHLENGPMMKLGLFHLDDGDRLLIVIHHLVIDGISWRILFEDIDTLYRQYKNGEKFSLPMKSDSFKLWAEKLSGYANSRSLQREKDYWGKLESMEIPVIEKDFGTENNYVTDARQMEFELSEDKTNLLLTKVNKSFGTEINDILLSALSLAIKKTFGHNRVLISLEGHGRDSVSEDLDITRTVGWFTSVYPVVLDVSPADDTGRQIKEIKETLRRIPNKGNGYGVLKYMTAQEYKKEIHFKLNPQIGFNYLGQFDADVKQTFFGIAEESAGSSQGPRNRRRHDIDVSGMIADGRLGLGLTYNKNHFKPKTMEDLMANLQTELEHIIAFCSAKEEAERTPSDFTYTGLSIESIDALTRSYPSMEEIYQLTPMQEGMLFHALYDKSSQVYFEQFSYRLHGELDIAIVEKSLDEITKRHDILRIAIAHRQVERAVQVVLKDRKIDFSYEDIRELDGAEEIQRFIDTFKETDRRRSFDLSKDPLMRIVILRLEEQEYELIWSHHHILMDGWCVGILNSEFFEFYNSFLEERPYRLPGIKPYRTYIQWRNKLDEKAMAEYWRDYLAGFDQQTAIPKRDPHKNTGGDYENGRFSFSVHSDKTKKLVDAAARNHVTMNTVVQTLWGILLGKYNGKEDVVFGAVMSGRPPGINGVESMVGIFINTVPVRIRFEGKTTIQQLLKQVQAEAVASDPQQYYSLAKIQSESHLKKDLIDNILVFENFPLAAEIKGYENQTGWELELSDMEAFEQTNYNFNLVVTNGEELDVRFDYNKHMFDDDYAEKMAGHFLKIIDQTIDNEEIAIGQLALLSDRERHQLLHRFNDTRAEYPNDKTIHQLFEEQVERTSDQWSVVSDQLKITYGELDQRANRLAYMLQEKGVGPDTIVAIKAERSIELVTGIMGILKAGGAYLPIDPDSAQDRIGYMLKDSSAIMLLTAQDIVQGLAGAMNCAPTTPTHPLTHSPTQLCYIIYTSGSTGKPKGVMMNHRGAVNYVWWAAGNYVGDEAVDFPLYTSIAFDLTVTSLLVPLVTGNAIVIYGEKDNSYLIQRVIEEARVGVVKLTPSHLKMVKEQRLVNHNLKIKRLVVGGEQLDTQLARDITMQLGSETGEIEIYNEYGPTEAAVGCMLFRFDKDGQHANRNAVPIGRPADNVGIYILDKYLDPVPEGVGGEIYISGDGLARGYLNRPELTAEKFIHLELNNQHLTLYRSGDLARWLPDENLEFLGRIDHQVKIRGFRIETGEIEAHLLNYPGIDEAVVIDRENRDGEKFLCAYLAAENEPDAPGLRNALLASLPDYMIPSHFIRVEKIPLTVNGKIDRKKLEAISIDMRIGVEYEAPRNEIERKIAGAWKEVLQLEKIGIHENFFDAGGTSLDVIKLDVILKQIFGETESVMQIFRYPTISSFAMYLSQKSQQLNHSAPNANREVRVDQIKNQRAAQKQKRKRR